MRFQSYNVMNQPTGHKISGKTTPTAPGRLDAIVMGSSIKVKLVIIEWLDSARPIADWLWLSDYKKTLPVSCVSVGFLIHDGDDIKALAPNMGDISTNNIQVSGIIHIPTCSVLKITELVEKL